MPRSVVIVLLSLVVLLLAIGLVSGCGNTPRTRVEALLVTPTASYAVLKAWDDHPIINLQTSLKSVPVHERASLLTWTAAEWAAAAPPHATTIDFRADDGVCLAIDPHGNPVLLTQRYDKKSKDFVWSVVGLADESAHGRDRSRVVHRVSTSGAPREPGTTWAFTWRAPWTAYDGTVTPAEGPEVCELSSGVNAVPPQVRDVLAASLMTVRECWLGADGACLLGRLKDGTWRAFDVATGNARALRVPQDARIVSASGSVEDLRLCITVTAEAVNRRIIDAAGRTIESFSVASGGGPQLEWCDWRHERTCYSSLVGYPLIEERLPVETVEWATGVVTKTTVPLPTAVK